MYRTLKANKKLAGHRHLLNRGVKTRVSTFFHSPSCVYQTIHLYVTQFLPYNFKNKIKSNIQAGGWEFFSSPPRSDRLWGPTQPPIQLVPGALCPEVKLTTHLLLVPMSRMRGVIPHPTPIRFHGVVHS